jgi:hypothetical protein
MAVQALADREQIAHLWGDVPALLVVAAVLAFLTRRATVAEASRLLSSPRATRDRLTPVA